MIDLLRYQIIRAMEAHKGKGLAISRRDLLLHLSPLWPSVGISALDREMRMIISEDESGICSCLKGYYLAADTAEAKEAVRFIDSYIIALAKRKRALLKAYPGAGEGIQGALPYE